jgi:hypothetical protein
MLENILERIPLPKGEGGAKHRVRGTARNCFSCGTPHPALRATLSLRERDLQKCTTQIFSPPLLEMIVFARTLVRA